MAVDTLAPNTSASIADDASDYGSDIDEATAIELFAQADSQPLKNLVLESIEEAEPRNGSLQKRGTLRLSQQSGNNIDAIARARQTREISVEVEYAESNRTTFSPFNPDEQKAASEAPPEPVINDLRSPLERFRTPPKKPLSVTDLVSPAWCEQQYEYSLTKFGRVRKTPAMKQGSSVHKVLEEQVHVQVPVQVVTKEDRFALRIWNTIQGLRTLRETGLTRELEIWGLIEGQVVIGIIDEISTNCPDEAMEARILDSSKSNDKKGKSQELPADQKTLTEYFLGPQSASVLESNPAFLGTLHDEKPPAYYYLLDVKTRQSRSLPAQGSQSRPTHMQLMIYHRMLSSLAANETDGSKIIERYRLDPEATFSDRFIAEIANLDVSAFASTPENPDVSATQTPDVLTELLEHNTLSSLWKLLSSEFSVTFNPSSAPSHRSDHRSISPLLTAEFRTARARYADAEQTELIEAAGTVIGRRSFPLDPAVLDAYIADEMRWWRGERETKGVEIEEAYKCRICDFADECVWRKTKVEEGLEKAKLRRDGRRRSEI